MDEEAICLLGGLFRFNEAISQAVSSIPAHTFRVEADRLTFVAIAEVFGRGDPVDLVAVYSRLRDGGQLEAAGGPARLAELWDRGCRNVELADLIQRVASR